MFIDSVKIYAKAGDGGNGCIALLREAFRPKGGPSGGDGGKGGDIILEASHDINNLVAQYYCPKTRAKNGLPGLGKNKTGKSGAPVVIKVPCGTTVWRFIDPSAPKVAKPSQKMPLLRSNQDKEEIEDDDQELQENEALKSAKIRQRGPEKGMEFNLEHQEEDDDQADSAVQRELVVDLVEHGQQILLCQGGKGGLGNQHFANSRNQTPRIAQPGKPGEEGTFILELRILAEIGLVGYPNAGKSTLLTALSKARPKIAAYPFTTLHPQIGVMEFEDYHRMNVCDIPGLIDGAHQNVGLGHAFLRHIQRCKALVLMIDMAGTDARKPWDDYDQLRQELELYDPEMLKKPFIVAANKMDMLEAVDYYRKFRRRVKGVTVFKLAAAFDEGLDKLKQSMREIGT